MGRVLRGIALSVLAAVCVFAWPGTHKAEDTLKAAKLKAADRNKAIFLIFGASWCEACYQLDSFLEVPEVALIFDKYFVIARVTFGEAAAGHPEWDDPGSDSLLERYGGIYPGGSVDLPFIALLDAKGKLIVNSTPTKGNSGSTGIGFPTEPGDVKWFLGMLQKAAPAMTEAEARKIQQNLQKVTAD